MSKIKEPNYFAHGDEDIDEIDHPYTICDFDRYIKLFTDVKYEKAIGEASHTYLYSTLASERIFSFNPHAKILVILRNPAERAYSHFLFLRRLGYENTLDFEKALELEKERIQKKKKIGHYLRRGYYFQQLKRWYNVFPEEQIKIYLYEDLQQDAIALMQDIYKFLGVNPYFEPDISLKSHPSGIVKNRFLYFLYRYGQINKGLLLKVLSTSIYAIFKNIGYYILNKSIEKPHLKKGIKRKLIAIYREDILHLQDLVKRDLSHWLQV